MAVVSIIIPTYGKPIYLEKAIKSVINQTFLNWELIVVDDNNPNTEERFATKKLLELYSSNYSNIKYIQHEFNKNGSAARNTGIKIAKGKYIAFLDSDDEYTPERLKKCVNIMEKSSLNFGGVYTGCEFRKRGRKTKYFTVANSGNYLVETLSCTFPFYTGSNIFMRSEVIRELEGFDTNFLRHQDYEFLVRFFKKYDLLGISEILVIKNDENFNLPKVERMIEIKSQYRDKYSNEIESLDIKKRKYIYHAHYIQIAEAALKSRKYEISKQYYKMAIENKFFNFKELIRFLGLLYINFKGIEL